MPCPDGSIDLNLLFKVMWGLCKGFRHSCHTHGILGHRNNVLLSVWDKKFEITNGTLNRYLVDL